MSSTNTSRSTRTAPLIPLPYIGDTPLDVIIFVSTAIYYRVYQWRRDARARSLALALSACSGKEEERLYSHSLAHSHSHLHREGDDNNGVVHRAKTVQGYKDPGLYEFMDMCVEQKQHLRKVGDPELARREKMKRISAESKSKLTCGLGLSPEKLLVERQRLQPTNQ